MSKVLIIIPAYNEEDNIEHVVDNLIEMYPQYDYVIINDGSIDNTPQICRKRGYNYIDLPINTGIGIVVQTGFKYALYNGYDYAVQFDCDGQHYPEYIKPLIATAEKGYNIVIGSRFVSDKRGMGLRMVGSRVLSALIFLTTGKYIADPTSGFKIYDRNLFKYYSRQINAAPEPDDLVYHIRCGLKVKEVQVKMGERISGLSYFNIITGALFMINMTVSILFIQTLRPIRKYR